MIVGMTPWPNSNYSWNNSKKNAKYAAVHQHTSMKPKVFFCCTTEEVAICSRTGNNMKYFCEIQNWKCETSLVLLLSTVRSLWGNEFEFTSIFPIIIISPATLRNNDVKTKHKIISHIHIIKLSYIWRLLRSCGFRFSERNVHCSSRSILNSRYQIYWAKK